LTIAEILQKLESGELFLCEGKLYTSEEWAKIREAEQQEEHFDLLQLTKKISLNSAYGSTLNEAFRFGRREVGASVTGTGRQISKHMGQEIARKITGKEWEFEKRFAKLKSTGNGYIEGDVYSKLLVDGKHDELRALPDTPSYIMKYSKEANKEVKVWAGAIWFTECPAIIYGDTDSCYFLTNGENYDDAVARADDIAACTNGTFPSFMAEAFNCHSGRENLIEGVREIVAESGLFMFAKKKYTLRVVNLDGKDLRAKPKLKSMGSEIKKADTPKIVQDFLKELMDLVLTGKEYPVLEKFVNSHRGSLLGPNTDVLSLAPAKQVNNLDKYYAEYQRTEKAGNGKMKTCPGHVRAAINYNELIELFEPGVAKPLKAGDKAAVLYLRKNQFNLKSMGFPTDLLHLPPWFNEHFSVDLTLTEEKMVDSKIEGIFEVLGWELPTPQNSFVNSVFGI
jgi:DNA polymerase elongation subunit (family B)